MGSESPFTYDDNGNLLSDDSLTYTWNVRNQLAGVSGAAGATFSYEAFGRRIDQEDGRRRATRDLVTDANNNTLKVACKSRPVQAP
jgi:hypothetical protein